MGQKKRWQIPVLVIGILLVLFFGTKAIMDMTGGPKVAVKAKDPEKRKAPAPVAETAEGADAGPVTPVPTPAAPAAPVSGEPEVEVAAMTLGARDPFKSLPGTQTVLPGAGVGPAPGAAGPPPEVPPVGPSAGPGPALVGVGPPPSWWPGGWPSPTAPGERRAAGDVTLVGTITGARNIAVVRDSSRPPGQQLVLASEGDRIGARGSPIQRIEPGSIYVRGQMGATHVYSAEQAAAGG